MTHVGSSPRVRGTVGRGENQRSGRRFIPACAGNRSTGRISISPPPVHPRVCGEQTQYPRVRVGSIGSSPRVRGTGSFTDPLIRQSRFIPACAGNSDLIEPSGQLSAVHPRVCGEQMTRRDERREGGGSSPRVRGTVHASAPIQAIARFIPACAGNSDLRAQARPALAVHPRVCGEQFRKKLNGCAGNGSSPRVRGTGALPALGISKRRFIPACAGNRATSKTLASALSVHPRVCGEQSRASTSAPALGMILPWSAPFFNAL